MAVNAGPACSDVHRPSLSSGLARGISSLLGEFGFNAALLEVLGFPGACHRENHVRNPALSPVDGNVSTMRRHHTAQSTGSRSICGRTRRRSRSRRQPILLRRVYGRTRRRSPGWGAVHEGAVRLPCSPPPRGPRERPLRAAHVIFTAPPSREPVRAASLLGGRSRSSRPPRVSLARSRPGASTPSPARAQTACRPYPCAARARSAR